MLMKLGSTTVFTASFNPVGSTDGSPNGEPFDGEFTGVIQTAGASGKITPFLVQRFANDNGTVEMKTWGGSSQMNQITIDTTSSLTIDLTWAWNAANASNSLDVNFVTIEILN
jgi:hypothetical protein